MLTKQNIKHYKMIFILLDMSQQMHPSLTFLRPLFMGPKLLNGKLQELSKLQTYVQEMLASGNEM